MSTKLADHRLVLTYYGDDFTGSTDVMESLTANGLPAVLFLRAPNESEVARFRDYRAIGVAGTSRSQTPEWMDENLPPVFERLKRLGAPVCHYKVCSTFDSAPHIGSIGRALDIGQRIFGNAWVPLVVGAPILKRYMVFGNLFATVKEVTHRIDRHPTMMRHPITPMDEGDLRLHMEKQTAKRIGLVDILALQGANPDARLAAALADGAEVVLFDILDHQSLVQSGRLVWNSANGSQVFTVGSSGFEYALVAYWQSTGELAPPAPRPGPLPADQIVAVSGSCAPTTEMQIRWALANGFEGIALSATDLAGPDGNLAAERAVAAGLKVLGEGKSAVLYTALGPESPMLLEVAPEHASEFGCSLGRRLGLILRAILERTGLRRAMVCGGDTSGHAGQQLGINAVTMIRQLAPGGPLCRAWSENPKFDGMEIVFKGGQVGTEPYFGWFRNGGPF